MMIMTMRIVLGWGCNMLTTIITPSTRLLVLSPPALPKPGSEFAVASSETTATAKNSQENDPDTATATATLDTTDITAIINHIDTVDIATVDTLIGTLNRDQAPKAEPNFSPSVVEQDPQKIRVHTNRAQINRAKKRHLELNPELPPAPELSPDEDHQLDPGNESSDLESKESSDPEDSNSSSGSQENNENPPKYTRSSRRCFSVQVL